MIRDESDVTTKFLSQLRQLGVRVWADGGRLRYQAAKGVMSPELLAELKTRKEEILAFIAMMEWGKESVAPELVLKPADRSQPLPLSLAQKMSLKFSSLAFTACSIWRRRWGVRQRPICWFIPTRLSR